MNTSDIIGDAKKDTWTLSGGHDIAGRTIHLKEVDVQVCMAYARNGQVEEKMAHIARTTRHGGLPFLCLLDANLPKEDAQTIIQDMGLNAEVVIPTGAAISCHVGKVARSIT